MEEYVASAMLDDKYVIEHKEMNGDFFIISAHTKNNGIVKVSLLRQKGDTSLECHASQAKTGGVPSPEATLAWLEKLCQTLTIK